MPLELIAVAPHTPELREYEDRDPGPGEVLVRSTLSAEKHGTTLLGYRDQNPLAGMSFDAEHWLLLHPDQPPSQTFYGPMSLGNLTAGIIEAVGPGVEAFAVGDRVFGYLPIRESHTVPADRVNRAPEGVADEMLVCTDPAMVALMGVREGLVRIGESVAVFGLGAIGLMAVRLAKIGGAAQVIAIEPLPLRAKLGPLYGADLVIDPSSTKDVGLAIREATGMQGVDISLETSGNLNALQQSVRGTRYAGAIVTVAWYHEGAAALRLGEEWHFNRQTLISGARLESVPYRDHPRWDPARIERTILQLFAQGRLTTEGMLDPRVPIAEAADAYRLIDEHPDQCVKLAVEYA
jgi:threonine dehydrogenase-like Zn-dependent dehydrogenase